MLPPREFELPSTSGMPGKHRSPRPQLPGYHYHGFKNVATLNPAWICPDMLTVFYDLFVTVIYFWFQVLHIYNGHKSDVKFLLPFRAHLASINETVIFFFDLFSSMTLMLTVIYLISGSTVELLHIYNERKSDIRFLLPFSAHLTSIDQTGILFYDLIMLTVIYFWFQVLHVTLISVFSYISVCCIHWSNRYSLLWLNFYCDIFLISGSTYL